MGVFDKRASLRKRGPSPRSPAPAAGPSSRHKPPDADHRSKNYLFSCQVKHTNCVPISIYEHLCGRGIVVDRIESGKCTEEEHSALIPVKTILRICKRHVATQSKNASVRRRGPRARGFEPKAQLTSRPWELGQRLSLAVRLEGPTHGPGAKAWGQGPLYPN